MATVTEPSSAQATSTEIPTVGPENHGLPMAYEDFIRADYQGAHFLYELSRGIVIVTEIPGIDHGRIVSRFRECFVIYDIAHRGFINYMAGGAECRLRFAAMKSDRHPDQAIYLHPYPKGPDLWSRWMPEIAIEVVSVSSQDRDYVLKREEYLASGIREYWILDPKRRRLLVLLNRGESWEEVLIPEDGTYQTELLPALEVRVGDLLGPPVPAEED
jgi:Uma2 family endonuclease